MSVYIDCNFIEGRKKRARKREDICKDFIVRVNARGIGFSLLPRTQWKQWRGVVSGVLPEIPWKS